eukprot:CAMPEP_0184293542 /NCGR_PEP_ID=MMETSP1049-20130417/4940_1 /TAXON_ID=77928 /ORGANISM="Proteomonas sulcata, Strain CCMP704" /LENGTH=69 /DNA_ID=CAMNT_0026601539 /DNA_START=83 /DNA_END=292 /DNA_ORIENTATION=+
MNQLQVNRSYTQLSIHQLVALSKWLAAAGLISRARTGGRLEVDWSRRFKLARGPAADPRPQAAQALRSV